MILPFVTARANLLPYIGAIAATTFAWGCARVSGDRDRNANAGKDTSSVTLSRTVRVPAPLNTLGPIEDSIASRLVFDPTIQTLYVAAMRKGRLLIDLGRVDDNVTRTLERFNAYQRAVAARSPIPSGARFRVRGPWGANDAAIESFDTWSGRIVGVLTPTPPPDSLSRRSPDSIVALAERDSLAPASPVAASCDRNWSPELRMRATLVRDSVEHFLRASERPVYPRLLKSLKTRRSMVKGCFKDGQAMVAVALYAGDYEWVRERIVLLSDSGAVRQVPVRDFRLRAHELLDAFDADDDGFDDVGARGYTVRAGAHVVLKYGDRKLERLAQGFAWER